MTCFTPNSANIWGKAAPVPPIPLDFTVPELYKVLQKSDVYDFFFLFSKGFHPKRPIVECTIAL